MYKKYIAGISVFLILVVFLFVKNLQKIKFTLFNPVSPAMSEEIWEGKTRVERFEFGSLLCNGIQLPVDYIEKTFYVPVDMETDQWETLDFASGNEDYQILFSEDFTQYDKKQLIAEGTDIEFLVYNDTEFSTYHMIFTGLPVIDISTAEGIDAGREISGNAVFYDTDFTVQGIQASAYHGHVRGNTSTLYPKKGYKLNLTKHKEDGSAEPNKLSLFDLRKDDDWILYAIYNDESKLRVKLCIDLWNELGAKKVSPGSTYNSNFTYVELIVDESYYGMYALMEPIDAKQLNLNSEDYLYKRKEQNSLSPEHFEQAKNPEEEVLGFEVKAGALTKDAWLPMEEFSRVVMASDEEFVKTIGNIIDEDNAMRLWLYIQVITGVDQVYKNAFYVAKKEGAAYRFSFAPWDMDLTWGNISADTEPFYTEFHEELIQKSLDWEPGNRLVRLNVNDSAEKMQKLYSELRRTCLSDGAIEERISGLNHIVRDSGAYERNHVRWPEEAYADDCGIVLHYAKERLKYLDTALYNLEDY